VFVHAEDPWLVAGGVVNEGGLATVLGLPGRPALAEELAVARDIALASSARCRLHMQHVSVSGALAHIRRARSGQTDSGQTDSEGAAVSCEATPHHLVLNEEACRRYDTNARVNPPLRSEDDRRGLVAALVDGTVDAVATDHAPHSAEEKALEFDAAPAGMAGLETAVGIMLTEFVGPGSISPARFVELLAANPARVLGCDEVGSLKPGARAHVTLIDPAREWTVDPEKFVSKARNTPFAGRALRGRAVMTFVDGHIAYRLD
jgi:dihydroorotase